MLSVNRSTVIRAVGCVLVLVATASCGDDAGTGAGTAEPGQAAGLADRAGLESEVVVGAICDGWALDQPDRATINEYVHDLLRPLDLVNGPDPPAFTSEEIDVLVVAACRDDVGDPEMFLRSVRDGLGLTESDLDGLVVSACDRYRLQQERIARGDWSGEDIAQFVRDLAADRGADLDELRAAVTGICAER